MQTNYSTIDCIDIYKQPAFDNPLLKNHKLQVPHSILPFSFHLVETLPQRGKNIEMMCDAEKADSSAHPQWEKVARFQMVWISIYRSSVISCPDGTVPIRRVTKDDLIREKLSVQLQDYDPFTSKDPNTYVSCNILHSHQQWHKSISITNSFGLNMRLCIVCSR